MLDVRDLSVSFVQYQGRFRQGVLCVISSLDLQARAGEVTAVVGSSGAGKSLLAHAVLGILPRNARVSGTIAFKGEPLTAKRQVQLRGSEIALIPQAVTFLDPLTRVGKQVRYSAHRATAAGSAEAQREVFRRYGLDEHVEDLYPFQLSGGMLRRVLVATAAISGASLIIADEPTPGLHPRALAEALRHFRELADDGAALVLITHDLQSAHTLADRVAVFYAGTTVELAEASAFSGDGSALLHPYSRSLWRSLPENDFEPVPGVQPLGDDLPAGCVFEPRCPRATEICRSQRPEARAHVGGWVRCFHA